MAQSLESSETRKNSIEKCGNCDRAIGRLEQTCVYKDTIVCRECNERLRHADEGGIETKRKDSVFAIQLEEVLGMVGSIVLFLGVFAPILRIPIMGSLNYFQNGQGDGTIIICLAVVSLVLILLKKCRGLWFTGLGSLGVLAFTFINFHVRMSETKSGLQAEMGDNPFGFLGELALESVQLEWGWAVLILGGAMVTSAAAVNMRKRHIRVIEREESGAGIVRDRIVILGRRGVGKTVYLSLLYESLWKSKKHLKMKCLHGEHHREFVKSAEELRRKHEWPEPTSSNRRAYIEITHKGQNRLMVAMDYSGELINKAFVK